MNPRQSPEDRENWGQIVENLKRLGSAERAEAIDRLPLPVVEALLGYWPLWARAEQLPPPGSWRTWLILAGRGFGKTRAGAEWVRNFAEQHPHGRIALVGASLQEARAVMVEGESGLLAIGPPHRRPKFEVSRRTVVWPSGAQARLFGAENPESLRGAQHHLAWADELAKWAYLDRNWMNLRMGLRLGPAPRLLVTTTPRPLPLLRQLLDDPSVVVSGGPTSANAANLGPGFLDDLIRDYGGTCWGRQELDGVLVDDVDGAMWNRALFERERVQAAPPLVRVVVGVDPPVSSGPSADACGIVVAGMAADGKAYVLADATVTNARPLVWAAHAAQVARDFAADRLVAEVNNGGDLVGTILAQVDPNLCVKQVWASRGKAARAEPIAARYEQGRVAHVGGLPDLEDLLCGMIAGGPYQGPGRSPDRADAAIWALSELFSRSGNAPGVRKL